jgi:hypothetical protein
MKSVVSFLLCACLCSALASCQKTAIVPPSNYNTASSNDPAKQFVSPIGTPDPVLGNVNTTISLVGTWKIAKDSSHFDGGALPGNATSTAYAGTSGDHFKFTGEGKLFIKENNIADTASYILTGDSKVVVSYLFYNGSPIASHGSVTASFSQVSLGNTAVTLVSSIATSQGTFYRKIDLVR